MKKLSGDFATLICDYGPGITLANWQIQGDWQPAMSKIYADREVHFDVKLHSKWYDAMHEVDDYVSGLHDLCTQLDALSNRRIASFDYSPFNSSYIGIFEMEFSTNNLGKIIIKGKLGDAHSDNVIHFEFETAPIDIDNFRNDIEKRLQHHADSRKI